MATGLWQLLATLQLDEVRRRLPRRLSGDFLDRDVLAAVFAPSRGELRVEPETAAQALMALVLAGSNPLMFQQPLAGPQIVELMLHGIRTSGRRRR